ncbi:zinc-binding dehydrogenase [Sneathiella glossodoripedis]|uniref:zinc-binding dehydrogenase n=1 Tax=Sneathiella glossodoripedis TaxID=418853 RepID=UPI00046EEC9F|nr:zinc-binding dehydrogenase [Sneathiella glossodoripedis]
MKAAVLFETGQPLKVVDDVELPALQKGQVEVEIAYSGVCHSQLMEVRGKRGEDRFLPHLLGHEATAIVRKCGAGVTKVAPGDKVILGWIRGEGLEAPGAIYSWNSKPLNSGGVTTFSQKSIVSENRVTPLPKGLSMKLGVLYGCAIPTGAGLAINEVNIKPGDTVIVIGIGGIGALSLMYASCQSPGKLIAIDTLQDKLDFAKTIGATHTILASGSTPLDEIQSITEGQLADIAIDAAGKSNTIELAFNAVKRKGGLCVFASHPEIGEQISLDPFELINGKQIRGSWGGATKPDSHIPLFHQMSLKHDLPLNKMVSKEYTLENVNSALDDLEMGRVMRPILSINPELENNDQ